MRAEASFNVCPMSARVPRGNFESRRASDYLRAAHSSTHQRAFRCFLTYSLRVSASRKGNWSFDDVIEWVHDPLNRRGLCAHLTDDVQNAFDDDTLLQLALPRADCRARRHAVMSIFNVDVAQF